MYRLCSGSSGSTSVLPRLCAFTSLDLRPLGEELPSVSCSSDVRLTRTVDSGGARWRRPCRAADVSDFFFFAGSARGGQACQLGGFNSGEMLPRLLLKNIYFNQRIITFYTLSDGLTH